jgi:hypothetical protein
MGVGSEALIDEASRALRRRGDVPGLRRNVIGRVAVPRRLVCDEGSQNARRAALVMGLPDNVAGVERHRFCASGPRKGTTLRPARSVPALISRSSRVASEFGHACRRDRLEAPESRWEGSHRMSWFG